MQQRSSLHVRDSAVPGRLAMTLVVAALGLAASAASATSVVSVICTGSDATTFSPGLRNFSQTVSFTETIEGHACAGLLGKIPGDNSFESGFAGAVELSCTTLFGPIMFTQVFTWSPSGRTSTWAASFGQTAYANGQLIATATGTIIDGDYKGANLTLVGIYPTAQLTACFSSPGLAALNGTMTWAFTGLVE